MGLRAGFLAIVILLIAGLAALNWPTLATPTVMSIGFMQVNAPLGVIMLALTTLLGLVCLAYVVYLQSTVVLETRRHGRELREQRELADKAEASRFTELRGLLETQEAARMAHNGERHAALLARIEHLENTLRQRAEQSDNTVAAHIGQLEDRLERGSPAPAPVTYTVSPPGTPVP